MSKSLEKHKNRVHIVDSFNVTISDSIKYFVEKERKKVIVDKTAVSNNILAMYQNDNRVKFY